MFLQKIALNPNESYETTTSIENLVENLQLIYNHIPIITLYSSKAMSDSEIKALFKVDKAAIELTIPQYKLFRDGFDSTHIVLPDYSLLKEFGYSISDLDKPLIITGNDIIDENVCNKKAKFSKLPLCRFFINSEKNERFVVAYILAQMNSSVIFTKHPERAKMFCKIFELTCRVCSYEVDRVEEDCAIFMDGYKEIECERIFVLGTRSMGFEKLSLDTGIAGKFKYRIMDVMKQLSPATVKKRDQFDYSRYKNINK